MWSIIPQGPFHNLRISLSPLLLFAVQPRMTSWESRVWRWSSGQSRRSSMGVTKSIKKRNEKMQYIYNLAFLANFQKTASIWFITYLYYYRLLPPSYSKINFLFVYLYFIYNNCNSIAIITILWPLLQYHCKYLPSIINVCGTIGREMATLIGQTHFFADNIVTLGDQTISGLVF